MIPESITTRLGRMRGRERALRLAWGAARFLAAVIVLLAVCCATDWLIDRFTETPPAVRVLLLALQMAFAAVVAGLWLLLPMTGRLGDDELTLRVEEGHPELGHRIISAVQLNRPGARTAGMSPELIRVVTAEADREARGLDFNGVLDHRRLKWAAAVVLPLALLTGAAFALMPETLPALLARQLMQDRDIPRSVHLVADTPEVHPEGGEVLLRLRVTGEDINDRMLGKVLLARDNDTSEEYTLAYDRRDGDAAYFTARVPPSSVDFSYRARLRDGRTRTPARVRFVPRPVVVAHEARILLPAFLGKRPDGGRYERMMERGDVEGHEGSTARVLVRTQKPIVRASLEMLGSAAGGDEEVRRTIPWEGTGQAAEFEFDLAEGETAYRVRVEDEYGFGNLVAPHQNVALLPDGLPRVVMLKDDQFADPGGAKFFAEEEVEGMPLEIGKPIRVRYSCELPLGLRAAQLKYRVNEGAWLILPLVEYRETEESGPFDPERSVFANSGRNDQVGFHAMNSRDPDAPPGLRGGGRFDFETAGLKDLKPGDNVEYTVEVYDRKPESDRPPGAASPPLVKRVVDKAEFGRWVAQTLEQERRLRELKEAQEKATNPPDD